MRFVVVALGTVLVTLTGCAAPPADGSPSRPSPTLMTTATATSTPSPSTEVPTMAFTLTSPDFTDGGAIPRRATCDGGDVSPALAWDGAPEGTRSLALLVDDPDARGFVHWVLFGLTGSTSGGLPAAVATSPDAPPQGTNGFGRVGYGGPCPPSGTHRYVFTLWALDRELDLTGAPSATELRAAIAGAILGTATLTGTYTRGG